MKTFYSYDTKEGRLFTAVLTWIIVLSSLGTVVFAISVFVPKGMFIKLFLFGISLAVLLLVIPARKKHAMRLKNETLVAHDWGIEHQIGDTKREVKWDQIQDVDTYDKSAVIYKMKEYVVTVAGEAPVVFYASLENADFLVNFIKKNLKKKAEELDVGWVKDK